MNEPIKRASPVSANDAIENMVTTVIDNGGRILDLGAGRGYMACRLAQRLREKGRDPAAQIMACDLSDTHYQCSSVPFQKIDANAPLPFLENSFDAVYAIEVFEHLGSPFDAMAEIHRILKPGGLIVLSVPNVLHLQSRIAFLFTGFHTLYVPPSTDPEKAGRICGHVMPLSYAYLAYGLRRSGFHNVAMQPDRLKRGSMFWLALLWPLLRLSSWRYGRNILKYDQDVHTENIDVLKMTNSTVMLLARSAIVSGIKLHTTSMQS